METIILKLNCLKKYLINKAIILGEHSPNNKKRIMYDTREALQQGGYLHIAAKLMWEKIKKYKPTYLIGSGIAAHNLMIAIQVLTELEGYNLNVLHARRQRKTNNRQRLIEGPRPNQNDIAIYIDDLINSGETWKRTKKALVDENIDLPIKAICVLIDFWNYKGSRRLEIQGIPIERVFYRHDFGDTKQDPKDSPLIKELAWRSLAHNQWMTWYKAPPLIYQDKVFYANDRHEVYCHELSTGKIIWKYCGPKPHQEKGTGGVLRVTDNILYFTSYDGTITAVNVENGKVKWKKYLDMFLHGSPWIDEKNNQIYIGTEGGISNKRGDIVCLNLETGNTKWRYPTNHVIPCSPRLIDNQVICGSNDGFLYSLNCVDGTLNFKIFTGEVKGRVNFINDVILATNENGKLYGISKTGNILWTRNCGSLSPHQFLPVHRSLGLVYVGNSDGMIAAYDSQGNQIWIRNVRENTLWNLILKNNELLLVTSKSGHLYKLDPSTGEKIQYQKLNYAVKCPCDFNDEYIVINSLLKGLYVYRRQYD